MDWPRTGSEQELLMRLKEKERAMRGECNSINGSRTLKLAEYIVAKNPE